VLITTLTKRMAEDLSEYYHDLGIKVRYLHSDIKTWRAEIIRDLRGAGFSTCWWGSTSCAKGWISHEVTLVGFSMRRRKGIFGLIDRDPDGWAGSEECAGPRDLYGDAVTDSMQMALAETVAGARFSRL